MDTRPPTPMEALDRKMDALADMIGNVHEIVESRTPDELALRAAVRDGIVAAASDPHVWSVAIETLQGQAQKQAGGWLLSGIKSALSKLALVLVVGLFIYLIGGWSALVAFLKHGSTT